MPPGATFPAPDYKHKTQALLRCWLCYDAALMLVIHTCGRCTIDGGVGSYIPEHSFTEMILICPGDLTKMFIF